MGILDSLSRRRSYYGITKILPVTEEEVTETIRRTTELVPDAFNMKSQRIVVAFGDKHNQLWDTIYKVLGGKASQEKIGGFKSGAGTILYFYDGDVVKKMQKQFPRYAENFPIWANQANGMLQLSIWTALRDLGIGANIQHYNPVIDERVKALFEVPQSYVHLAQMPFGGIMAERELKEKEDISKRVVIRK